MLNLKLVIGKALPEIAEIMGLDLTQALKRRDKREPLRREKELAEDRLMSVIMRIFRKQKRRVQERLEREFYGRKAIKAFDDWDFEDDEEDILDLIMELQLAARNGGVFAASQIPLQFETAAINTEALAWARKYGYDLVRNINQTTVDTLRTAISNFIQTPGMTIGDVMSMLPFDADRALRVSVTEVTRAYAEGNRIAGEELQDQFPGVDVIEIWFTNNDDLVCDICGPLDGMSVALDEPFDAVNDIMRPPAHPNCRCWTETSTRLA